MQHKSRSMKLPTFETLSNDLVCLVLEKTLKPNPPGIDTATLASLACVSGRYAALMKAIGWERPCRKAVPDFCELLVTAGKKSPGDAGWASFAKLLSKCPGYDMKRVTVSHFRPYIPKNWPCLLALAEWGQARGLEMFRVGLDSHTDDDWAYFTSLETPVETYFRIGEDMLPGLLGYERTPIMLIPYQRAPSPRVSITPTKWKSSKAPWDQWTEMQPAGEQSQTRSAPVVVYRGIVSDMGALTFFSDAANSDPEDHEEIYEDIYSALSRSTKEFGGWQAAPLSKKRCPFCSRSMQRLPKSLYSTQEFHWKKSAVAEFFICRKGHIYGVSVKAISREGDDGFWQDAFEDRDEEEFDDEN